MCFPGHKFQRHRTLKETQEFLEKHKKEILEMLLTELPKTIEAVEKIGESKKVSSEVMQLNITR